MAWEFHWPPAVNSKMNPLRVVLLWRSYHSPESTILILPSIKLCGRFDLRHLVFTNHIQKDSWMNSNEVCLSLRSILWLASLSKTEHFLAIYGNFSGHLAVALYVLYSYTDTWISLISYILDKCKPKHGTAHSVSNVSGMWLVPPLYNCHCLSPQYCPYWLPASASPSHCAPTLAQSIPKNWLIQQPEWFS